MLGQWRNYDDLEEALTLDELMVTYSKILDNRTEHMEFSAKIAGVEIKKSSAPPSGSQSSEKKPSSIVDNLRKARESELQTKAKTSNGATFSDGVAYKVI